MNWCIALHRRAGGTLPSGLNGADDGCVVVAVGTQVVDTRSRTIGRDAGQKAARRLWVVQQRISRVAAGPLHVGNRAPEPHVVRMEGTEEPCRTRLEGTVEDRHRLQIEPDVHVGGACHFDQMPK